jgi:hypothetical protein
MSVKQKTAKALIEKTLANPHFQPIGLRIFFVQQFPYQPSKPKSGQK